MAKNIYVLNSMPIKAARHITGTISNGIVIKFYQDSVFYVFHTCIKYPQSYQSLLLFVCGSFYCSGIVFGVCGSHLLTLSHVIQMKVLKLSVNDWPKVYPANLRIVTIQDRTRFNVGVFFLHQVISIQSIGVFWCLSSRS